ncbi:anthranilate phosphoribosyltransferase [Methermicoccus shengliensis]|uniref:Anthranilate phosphoribosyltransferase n=1 Tax=Methermicoccus shengliensis TaxID=660064 RepID=A0A832RWF0_9EURY|nr:anthranilate phosphoribosyltransferase [Methermicoccus shengliensis]KUK04711.1 MAG: Anthranilate phosphoribosyltransferase [Euryarchaeota archaeon 55_53]KUK30522.1 MAG: Anthranilate phosphoribosyltransferase [Methanosarcinales archeaon 56_1174]MDI3487429.1 anthranilate phosphoribosyltransferase [Methanosarcinales archaeon]MDN5295242.1 anthranilate phosphoribosyltransferase [Methanosarcinales archaeon]HIH69669.1 anthranilate phosphoribosyltransferase [Methermicoccus shengliensis]
MKEYLLRLVEGEHLTKEEACELMLSLLDGASNAQIAALLTTLRLRGVSPAELAGLALGMRQAALTIHPDVDMLVDTCGTGGDGLSTFNISTACALVVAACGVPVAKHGNRAFTSRCGSADVLEALGMRTDMSAGEVKSMIENVGFGFLLASVFHPSMRKVAPVRSELGFRTVFNVLGPLTNPAGATAQLVGVYDEELVPLVAHALLELGTRRAMVVHGGGMDEISSYSTTSVCEIRGNSVEHYTLSPEDFSLPTTKLSDILGGCPAENAQYVRSVLEGRRGPRRDVVLMNAGAVLYIAGAASSLLDGAEMAACAIDSGEALAKLEHVVHFCAPKEAQ